MDMAAERARALAPRFCLSPPSLSLGRERRAKSTLGTRKTHPLYIRPDFTSGGGGGIHRGGRIMRVV